MDSPFDKLYAHSREGRLPVEWHLLKEHLASVAAVAERFASAFGSADWAFNAGWLHDLGKADDRFQAYLFRENGLDDAEYDAPGKARVNHSGAGAAQAEEWFGPSAGRVLAYLVSGHHAGLPDWHTAETGAAALSARLQEGKDNLSRVRFFAEELRGSIRAVRLPPAFVAPANVHLWVRMLFSCLVDADFLDTESFTDPERAGTRVGFASLPELKQRLDKHLARLAEAAPRTDVNAARREVLTACRKAAVLGPGLFSLTVPTGGGKTLSATAFALDHAIAHGRSRVIYVIPFTSIIEQTAGILADILGRENVVEHHSNLDPERETPRSRLASENWDAPVVVTTNVQFFESMYAAKPGRCRKLHNIVNSVVILDEAQLLPPNLLTPCVDAINQLRRHYGVTFVLSTATQPALPHLDEPREIVPDPGGLYARLHRTLIEFPETLEPTDWETIASRLREYEQVLCVVNTRRDCRELFDLMPEGTIHLSALMCGAHRSEAIARVKRLLVEGKPARVISTQLVEAGVDIDFPVVFRALAGLDSIAQAAGRCNREGRLNAAGRRGRVVVFVPPQASPRGLLRKGEDTTRELLSAYDGFSPDRPDAITHYFGLFYSKVNDTGTIFRDLLVKDVNPGMSIQFRTAADKFQMIDDQAQRPVLVRYGEGAELIGRLAAEGPHRSLMRMLQRYTVNLPVRMVDAMVNDGRLERVLPRKAPEIVAQCALKLYDPRLGLDVYAERLPVEDLMI